MIHMKSSLAGLAIVAAAGFGLWSLAPDNNLLPLTPAMAQETASSETTAAPSAVEVKDMTLGQQDAPVTIIEYASYTCPHCATFHQQVFKPLKQDYIDTGKVHYTYREVYFDGDRPAFWAGMVARCGGDMRYFGIQDLIFSKQQEWLDATDLAGISANLKKLGLAAGLDQASLDACLTDAGMAQEMLDLFNRNMAEYEVRGTPTLVVNGTVQKNMSYDDLKTIIDAELAK
jgi:protein-disulfide isomerase